MTIVPAILPTSRADLEGKLARFATVPEITDVQIDVVDGHFASPASWPYTALEEFEGMVGRKEHLPYVQRFHYDIDLMVSNPERAIAAWIPMGAARLTVHLESVTSPGHIISLMRHTYGHDVDFVPNLLSFGLAIGIETDLALLEPYVPCVDYLQFMGITHIGKQGQPFDARVIEKIKKFHATHPQLAIQVDGGVSLVSARKLLAAGASRLVVGSALLSAPDLSLEMQKFEQLEMAHGIYGQG